MGLKEQHGMNAMVVWVKKHGSGIYCDHFATEGFFQARQGNVSC